MDITTQPNFVFVGPGILELDDTLLRLEPELDDFSIRLEKPDIFDKMVFFYLMGTVHSPYLDDDIPSLLPIEGDMAGFLITDSSRTGNFLNIHRGFYEAVFGFSAMRTYPGFAQWFKGGSWKNILLSDERIIYVGTSGAGKFLHKIKKV